MTNKFASLFQPTKFLLMILQINVITVIIQVKDSHILPGIGMAYDQTSTQYATANSQVMFWCVFSLILLVLEFGIIFSGRTLFNHKYNLIVIALHVWGLFLSSQFLIYEGHYQRIAALSVFNSILPVTAEFLSMVFSQMNYRKEFTV